MSERDCTAVRIELLIHIDAKVFSYCYGLCCKSFVCFDNFEVFDLHACLFHYFLCRCHRADSHNFRPYASQRASHISSHRLNAQFFRFFFAHNNDRCSAVVNAGCISCRNESIWIDRAEFRKAFYRRTCTRAFVYLELNHFFFLLYHNRYDFLIECAGFLSSFRFLLALQCELVQFFPCQTPFFTNVVCRLNHVILVKCIPKSIVYHGIYQSAVVHSITEACIGHCIRSHRHIFHTACYYDVRISCQDHLCCLIDTVKAGTAYNVHGNCRNFDRKPCFDGCLTSYVLSKPRLDNTSHVYLIHLLRGNPRPV